MNRNSGYKLGSPELRRPPPGQPQPHRFGLNLVAMQQSAETGSNGPSSPTAQLRLMHSSPRIGINLGEPPRPLSRHSSTSQLEFESAVTDQDLLEQVRAHDPHHEQLARLQTEAVTRPSRQAFVLTREQQMAMQYKQYEDKRASKRTYGYHHEMMFENEDGDGGVDQ